MDIILVWVLIGSILIGLFSSLNFLKIITNEPSVEYELEGNYECNISCQEDFEAS